MSGFRAKNRPLCFVLLKIVSLTNRDTDDDTVASGLSHGERAGKPDVLRRGPDGDGVFAGGDSPLLGRDVPVRDVPIGQRVTPG